MTNNHIGKTIYVAQALPATNNAAGFEALTWVQVKGVQVLPQLGTTHATIDVDDLATGRTTKLKGMASGVSTTASFRTVAADAGQADVLEQCEDSAGLISIKIGTGTGTDSGDGPALETGDAVEYAQGIAHSYQPIQGDGTTHEGFQFTFEQNANTVIATEPA